MIPRDHVQKNAFDTQNVPEDPSIQHMWAIGAFSNQTARVSSTHHTTEEVTGAVKEEPTEEPSSTTDSVTIHCTVVRRGTAQNCPDTLGRRRRREQKAGQKGERKAEKVPAPPSKELIFEQYEISMSRLSHENSFKESDLKLCLQNISGISSDRLKLCKVDGTLVNVKDEYTKLTRARDRTGPCDQVAKQSPFDDFSTPVNAPTQIIAFETTLAPRPPPCSLREDENSIESSSNHEDESIAEVDREDEPAIRKRSTTQQQDLQEYLQLCGDQQECRVYDTDPTPIARAMSRSLWPRSCSDFKLGLRVDAVDHRDVWFPGSVVKIIEGNKVKVHIDNFSSKWDEIYTFEHFKRGQVRPLYSHTSPRAKPTEFLVHHRYRKRSTKVNALFGQAFYLQCQNEWTLARAGAHILAQAARFLQPPPCCRTDSANRRSNIVDLDDGPVDKTDAQQFEALEDSRSVISELIDVLVESDRQYGEAAILSTGKYLQSSYQILSSILSKRLSESLPRLPFDISVCITDSLLGAEEGGVCNEVSFPFSLVRTIGNYMTRHNAVVLQWRAVRHSRSDPTSSTSILYFQPTVGVHNQCISLRSQQRQSQTCSLKMGLQSAQVLEEQLSEKEGTDVDECVCCCEITNDSMAVCPDGHITCSECFMKLFDLSLNRNRNDLKVNEQKQARYMVECCGGCSKHFGVKMTTSMLSEEQVVRWEVTNKKLYKYLNLEKWIRENEAKSMEAKRVEEIRESFRAADGTYTAYQCPQCGYGPKPLAACDNLQTHHGQAVRNPRTGQVYRRNNACENCGWFGNHINMWVPWDGTVRPLSPKTNRSSGGQAADISQEPRQILLGMGYAIEQIRRPSVARAIQTVQTRPRASSADAVVAAVDALASPQHQQRRVTGWRRLGLSRRNMASF